MVKRKGEADDDEDDNSGEDSTRSTGTVEDHGEEIHNHTHNY